MRINHVRVNNDNLRNKSQHPEVELWLLTGSGEVRGLVGWELHTSVWEEEDLKASQMSSDPARSQTGPVPPATSSSHPWKTSSSAYWGLLIGGLAGVYPVAVHVHGLRQVWEEARIKEQKKGNRAVSESPFSIVAVGSNSRNVCVHYAPRLSNNPPMGITCWMYW